MFSLRSETFRYLIGFLSLQHAVVALIGRKFWQGIFRFATCFASIPWPNLFVYESSDSCVS